MKLSAAAGFALAFMIAACQNQAGTESETANGSEKAVTLKLNWETETLLTTSESVIYDKDRDVVFVSCINGEGEGKDGDGFIAKVSPDGKIMQAGWVAGLNNPTGLGIFNGRLYVADINEIVEIHIDSAQIVAKYPVEGGQFLNDIAVDATGKVYVSDSETGKISVLENGKVSTWTDGIKGANGLLAEGDQMLALSWNDKTLFGIDMTTKTRTIIAEDLEGPDGVEALGGGAYLVSSWAGMLHYVAPGGKIQLLLDTRADKTGAADIDYIPEKRLLLVPTFYRNSVMAYEVGE